MNELVNSIQINCDGTHGEPIRVRPLARPVEAIVHSYRDGAMAVCCPFIDTDGKCRAIFTRTPQQIELNPYKMAAGVVTCCFLTPVTLDLDLGPVTFVQQVKEIPQVVNNNSSPKS